MAIHREKGGETTAAVMPMAINTHLRILDVARRPILKGVQSICTRLWWVSKTLP
mgnify:CR=1 FL=1